MEKPFCLSKEFVESLDKIGEQDYKKIDAVLKEMSKESTKDLLKIKKL
jgi:hypothetical protein